jgi:hypothetical protein
MDWVKFNSIPTEFATAREIGLAAATLGAMARKGFVETLDTVPKQYRRINSPAVRTYKFLDEHKKEYNTYFVLWRKGKKLGMLCQMSGDKIVDCWGNNYDATDVVSICLGNKMYSLEEG